MIAQADYDARVSAATAVARKAEGEAEAAPAVIVSYKGFDQDLKCLGFQYEVGKSYTHDGAAKACKSGFHACEYPLDVLRYYSPNSARFAVVEQGGQLARHAEDSKVASTHIKVSAEIGLPGLIKAAIEYTTSRCKPIDPASPAYSTEDNGAATASGYNGAATASGDSGAATASGYGGRVRGADGCALFLVERNDGYEIISVWAGIAGCGGIKADTFYTLRGGKPAEVAA